MGKSYKSHPGGGMCSAGGQKQFKTQENKAKRRKVNQLLKTNNYDMPHEKEYGNEWASPRDGKQYWIKPKENEQKTFLGRLVFKSIEYWYKWMRK